VNESELSFELRQFLDTFVHTFEDLEVLLLLYRRADEALTLQEVHSALKLNSELAASALDDLTQRGIAQKLSDEPPRFRYASPRSAQKVVDELARVHAEQHIALITTIASNAITRVRTSAIRTFAEAFMLRKGKKDNG
jgi:hypothetical protein